jgi:hypothetical protein
VIRRPARWLRHVPRRALVVLVRVYQKTLSPLVGGHCKYLPTCSEYFIQAVESRGAVRGAIQGLWRICRCNPWASGGYDPVDPPGGDASSPGPGQRPSGQQRLGHGDESLDEPLG